MCWATVQGTLPLRLHRGHRTGETRWGLIRMNGLPDLNQSVVYLLDFCAKYSLSKTNTMFKKKGVHKRGPGQVSCAQMYSEDHFAEPPACEWDFHPNFQQNLWSIQRKVGLKKRNMFNAWGACTNLQLQSGCCLFWQQCPNWVVKPSSWRSPIRLG